MLRALVVVLAGGLAAVPGGAAEPPTKGGGVLAPAGVKPAPSVEAILNVLHTQRVQYEKNLNDTPLFEVLADLAKRFDLTFVIRTELFKEQGVADIREAKPTLAVTRLEGLTLHRFLNLVLQDLGAVYLVRPDYLEIVPRITAFKEAGLGEADIERQRDMPFVSVTATNAPLVDVLGHTARSYGLNVVLDPSARRAMKDVTVTEQLLNVPADTALELLAGQAGLSVVRKGNTFRVTASGM
jgi:type II secretory pathway component GspD/PulD (secretin)